MATLTWPASIVPQSVTWRLRANTQSFTSPLSGATQTAELAGARWLADLNLPALDTARWRAWSAFAARMRGQAGRVYFGPPQYSGPQADTWAADPSAVTCDSTAVTCDSTALTVDALPYATRLGTPLVDGAAQTGNSLATDGWEPGITVMRAGDYLSYDTATGRSLHIVTDAEVRSDGLGRASIGIEPPIRSAPADNAAIEVQTPSCVMGLLDDDQGATTYEPGIIGRAAVQLVERF
jgi:hypothetical protein